MLNGFPCRCGFYFILEYLLQVETKITSREISVYNEKREKMMMKEEKMRENYLQKYSNKLNEAIL